MTQGREVQVPAKTDFLPKANRDEATVFASLLSANNDRSQERSLMFIPRRGREPLALPARSQREASRNSLFDRPIFHIALPDADWVGSYTAINTFNCRYVNLIRSGSSSGIRRRSSCEAPDYE